MFPLFNCGTGWGFHTCNGLWRKDVKLNICCLHTMNRMVIPRWMGWEEDSTLATGCGGKMSSWTGNSTVNPMLITHGEWDEKLNPLEWVGVLIQFKLTPESSPRWWKRWLNGNCSVPTLSLKAYNKADKITQYLFLRPELRFDLSEWNNKQQVGE